MPDGERSHVLRAVAGVVVALVVAVAVGTVTGTGRDRPATRAAPSQPPTGPPLAPYLHLTEALLPVEAAPDGEPIVSFRFSGFVRAPVTPTAFRLRGYGGRDVAVASATRVAPGSTDTVHATFRAVGDLARFSLAMVARAAVSDETGAVNLPGAAPLGGSGRPVPDAVGPLLVDAAPLATLRRVTFRFDQELDRSTPPRPAGLGFLTPEGRLVHAKQVVAVRGAEVEARFAFPVSVAARFVADAGAVRGRNGSPAPPSAVGGATAAPALAGVTTGDDERQLDFLFDAVVAGVDRRRFVVYGDDGVRRAAAAYSRPAPHVVRVTFPTIREPARDVAVAGVEAGAVRGVEEVGPRSAPASLSLTRGASAGRTAGPDVVAATISPSGEVELRFDEPLREARSIARWTVTLVLSTGELVPARFALDPRAERAVVVFDGTTAARAAGIVVSTGAVADEAGYGNPTVAFVDPVPRSRDRWT